MFGATMSPVLSTITMMCLFSSLSPYFNIFFSEKKIGFSSLKKGFLLPSLSLWNGTRKKRLMKFLMGSVWFLFNQYYIYSEEGQCEHTATHTAHSSLF